MRRKQNIAIIWVWVYLLILIEYISEATIHLFNLLSLLFSSFKITLKFHTVGGIPWLEGHMTMGEWDSLSLEGNQHGVAEGKGLRSKGLHLVLSPNDLNHSVTLGFRICKRGWWLTTCRAVGESWRQDVWRMGGANGDLWSRVCFMALWINTPRSSCL